MPSHRLRAVRDDDLQPFYDKIGALIEEGNEEHGLDLRVLAFRGSEVVKSFMAPALQELLGAQPPLQQQTTQREDEPNDVEMPTSSAKEMEDAESGSEDASNAEAESDGDNSATLVHVCEKVVVKGKAEKRKCVFCPFSSAIPATGYGCALCASHFHPHCFEAFHRISGLGAQPVAADFLGGAGEKG